ncbi:cyclophilin-like domain-containing protein [Trametes elegans]|nr:cyclophilin-like domain-containing protein [Trametes elegans]
MVRPRVFFDVTIDSQPAGRIIFELYNDTAPKTSENFRALCTGEKGLSPLSERPLYYKNSIIHRSIKDFMIQGGDFTKRNGTGGESIYGGPFPDEDLSRPLNAAGLLCMANKGPNTNNSQFFITLRDCPHLNGKHVVFGHVIRGYEVVERITQVPTDEKDRPRAPVVIANSGELMLRSQVQQKKPERARESPLLVHIRAYS